MRPGAHQSNLRIAPGGGGFLWSPREPLAKLRGDIPNSLTECCAWL